VGSRLPNVASRIPRHIAIHGKLTATVGTLMAQTGKMQTYQDAIEAMLNQSVILPPELLAEIENFIEENK